MAMLNNQMVNSPFCGGTKNQLSRWEKGFNFSAKTLCLSRAWAAVPAGPLGPLGLGIGTINGGI
jgi:hypothetical protein